MEKLPTTINIKELELPTIKAHTWINIVKFNDEKKDISAVEAVDKYCEVIALAFGVSKDEVLKNLNIEDVMPLYFEILKRVSAMLTAKLPKKNETVEEKV